MQPYLLIDSISNRLPYSPDSGNILTCSPHCFSIAEDLSIKIRGDVLPQDGQRRSCTNHHVTSRRSSLQAVRGYKVALQSITSRPSDGYYGIIHGNGEEFTLSRQLINPTYPAYSYQTFVIAKLVRHHNIFASLTFALFRILPRSHHHISLAFSLDGLKLLLQNYQSDPAKLFFTTEIAPDFTGREFQLLVDLIWRETPATNQLNFSNHQ